MTSSHGDSKTDLKAHHTTLLQTHIPKKKPLVWQLLLMLWKVFYVSLHIRYFVCMYMWWVCICVSVCVYVFVCMCAYVWVSVCVYVCVHVSMGKQKTALYFTLSRKLKTKQEVTRGTTPRPISCFLKLCPIYLLVLEPPKLAPLSGSQAFKPWAYGGWYIFKLWQLWKEWKI